MSAGVAFVVQGQAVPQGSKTAIHRGGRTVVVEGSREKLRPWRQTLAAEAAVAMNGRPVMSGPVMVQAYIYLQRPKAHYRRDGTLKDTAPDWHGTRPDAEKLARAIADALTGVVYRDDGQVAAWIIAKCYGDPPRVSLKVSPL